MFSPQKRKKLSRQRTRRRLQEVDQLPGLDPLDIDRQAAAARRRMKAVVEAPEEWRRLLDDYPHQEVAMMADRYPDAAGARKELELRFGKPV